MSKPKMIVSAIAFCAFLGVSAFALPAATKSAAKTPPVAKAKPAPKTDAEIQTCIEGKLAASAKLKDQHFTVAVVGGTATFAGVAKNAGNKGGVDSIAKSCGAKTVVNNITVEKPPAAPAKPKKP